MTSRESHASAQHAECNCAVSKRSRTTFGRMEYGKRQYRRRIVVIFRVGAKCGGGKTKGEKKMPKRMKSTFQEFQGSGCTKAWCCVSDVALGSAIKAESSSSADILSETCDREIYSSESSPVLIIVVTGCTPWQESVSAR